MKNLIIRHVEPDDLKQCHLIEASCYESSEAATEEKIKNRIKLFTEGFLVAELDNEVVGFINSGATHQVDLADEDFKDLIGHDPNGENIVIMSVTVHKAHQKKGIAGLLIDEFIQTMKRLTKEHIFLICKTDLIDFYKKFGFNYISRSQSNHGGFEWHEMSLKL